MMDLRIAPLLATAIGCSPYDPDLGAQPFFCGDGEPRCPDGYVCVERVGTDQICAREDGVADAGGDGNLMCSADAAMEPNDTISNPTLVPIPDVGETHMVSAVICPMTDIDVYRLNVDTTGKNVRVEVTYESLRGELTVDLLNSTGIPIRTATPTNNNPDKLRADFANLAQGTYYGRIKGVVNNYAATFLVSASPLPL
ncbi:MAG TPA: hypothetical protein VIV11_04940 [Kofleriaceae bacterium]